MQLVVKTTCMLLLFGLLLSAEASSARRDEQNNPRRLMTVKSMKQYHAVVYIKSNYNQRSMKEPKSSEETHTTRLRPGVRRQMPIRMKVWKKWKASDTQSDVFYHDDPNMGTSRKYYEEVREHYKYYTSSTMKSKSKSKSKTKTSKSKSTKAKTKETSGKTNSHYYYSTESNSGSSKGKIAFMMSTSKGKGT
eukprot:scaffold44995_cov160-Amphora_coffeaeformis.AAC.2